MPTYILRDIDPILWSRVKARAANMELPLKALFTGLLRDFADNKIAPESNCAHEFRASYGNRDYCLMCGEHRGKHRAL
jgi:hypothetical protein